MHNGGPDPAVEENLVLLCLNTVSDMPSTGVHCGAEKHLPWTRGKVGGQRQFKEAFWFNTIF